MQAAQADAKQPRCVYYSSVNLALCSDEEVMFVLLLCFVSLRSLRMLPPKKI